MGPPGSSLPFSGITFAQKVARLYLRWLCGVLELGLDLSMAPDGAVMSKHRGPPLLSETEVQIFPVLL